MDEAKLRVRYYFVLPLFCLLKSRGCEIDRMMKRQNYKADGRGRSLAASEVLFCPLLFCLLKSRGCERDKMMKGQNY